MEFDKTTRTYMHNGKPVSRRELRKVLEKLLDATKTKTGKIAAKLDKGLISNVEFEIEMREALKSAHIVAATIGRGGRKAMTAKDWERAGAKIEWQNGYLAKFAKKLGKGILSKAATESRAKAYVSAVYVSYADSVKEVREEWKELTGKEPMVRLVQSSKEGCEECNSDAAEGWMPESEMAPLFSRICGDFCLCEIEWDDDDGSSPDFTEAAVNLVFGVSE